MRAYLAIHEPGPVLYVSNHTVGLMAVVADVDPKALTVRLDVIDDELLVDLSPEPGGVNYRPARNPENDPEPLAFYQETEVVARCSPLPVTLLTGFRSLRATLPRKWELPWPFLKVGNFGTFDKHAAVVREIRVRMDAKGAATGERSLCIPAHVQALLSPAERVRLFSEWRI